MTFGCIVKMSKVRSVDNRRSRSVIGIDNVEVELLRSIEVALVSCEKALLQFIRLA